MNTPSTISRRKLLTRAIAGIACPICAGAIGPGLALASGDVHWTYDGESGPEHWGGLSTDFKVC